jgi:hypothetical protein
MARNKYEGRCYKCGLTVEVGTGHFERRGRGWRVKHADVLGDGRVTCDLAVPSYADTVHPFSSEAFEQ